MIDKHLKKSLENAVFNGFKAHELLITLLDVGINISKLISVCLKKGTRKLYLEANSRCGY